jgi:hypothetical protein
LSTKQFKLAAKKPDCARRRHLKFQVLCVYYGVTIGGYLYVEAVVENHLRDIADLSCVFGLAEAPGRQ